MKLSRTILYAIQATLHLAEAGQDGPVPCSRLADKGQMPERFLLQILRYLVRDGLLRSTRGVEGGYSLNRPAEEITLLDLIEAIDGKLESGIPEKIGLDNETMVQLENAMDRVNDQLRDGLSNIRLTDLMTQSDATTTDTAAEEKVQS